MFDLKTDVIVCKDRSRLSLRGGPGIVMKHFLWLVHSEALLIKKVWQRPTLPPKGSTIGAEGLNFRVRDGNGWFPFAVVTRL